jgi:hypothetical protein
MANDDATEDHYRRLLAAAIPADLPDAEQDRLRDLLRWQRHAETPDPTPKGEPGR